MISRITTIALHEYWSNVRRKEFILITLGMPILFLGFGGLSALGTGVAAGALRASSHVQAIGLVDPGRALRLPLPEGERPPGVSIRTYTDPAAGQEDVRHGRLDGLIVLDPDYLDNGRVTVYRKSGGLLSRSNRVPVGDVLTRALLHRTGAERRLVRRAAEPTGEDAPRVYVLDRAGRFVPRDIGREAADFVVPYAFTILLTTSIFVSSSYLLRGIADEKENRVIEVILSSVTPPELLRGKLLGLAGVGLTQVAIWMGMAAIPAALMFGRYVHLSPVVLLEVVLFFALGYAFYATFMAGLGALGTSYRESQQIAGVVSIGAIFPVIFLPVLLEFPNGLFARVFSLIPPTAPTTMVLRVTAADVPAGDVLLSALVTALGAWLVLRLSERLFRFGLLITGKRPGLAETLRWLRQT